VEFSLPVRIRWDADRPAGGDPAAVARALSDASPLFLELRFSTGAGVLLLPAILRELGEPLPRTTVFLPGGPESRELLARSLPVSFLWPAPAEGEGEEAPEGVEGFWFVPDSEGIGRLPSVVRRFARSALPVLHLPNVNALLPLEEGRGVPVPAPGRCEAAAAELAADLPDLSGKRLAVHDYFLWDALRKLFPGSLGERLEFSGCQAGSALAYVDGRGALYACDSLPGSFGSLASSSFEDLWGSPARADAAAAVRAIPAPCAPCPLRPSCLGGCRGLALAAGGSLALPDLSCPAPGSPEEKS
jgi:radical SAM protein with 4Fe4S-binding SPASM domain